MLLFVLFLVVFDVEDVWAWRGPEDNRTVAELELLEEHELANEAQDICTILVVYKSNPNLQVEAGRYMQTVSAVARKKNKGKSPWWVEEIQQLAYVKQDASGCVDVLMKVIDQTKQKK